MNPSIRNVLAVIAGIDLAIAYIPMGWIGGKIAYRK